MKMAQKIARILLGLMMFVFGLNGFLNFIPAPPEMPEGAVAMMNAFVNSGYLMAFIKGTEVVVGLALLANLFTPLALVILAPITLNIFAFHFFVTPGLQNVIMPIVIIALHVVAAMEHKDKFAPLLKAK